MRYILFLLPSLFLLNACSGIESEAKYPTGADRVTTGGDIYAEPESIFGKGGIAGALRGDSSDDNGATIGVNAYLWRASLDTISFMPIEKADPFGGTIFTDWYVSSEMPNERLKLNVFILNKELRSDAIRVRLFQQVKKNGKWVDTESSAETVRKLEDAVLIRARQLRVADL